MILQACRIDGYFVPGDNCLGIPILDALFPAWRRYIIGSIRCHAQCRSLDSFSRCCVSRSICGRLLRIARQPIPVAHFSRNDGTLRPVFVLQTGMVQRVQLVPSVTTGTSGGRTHESTLWTVFQRSCKYLIPLIYSTDIMLWHCAYLGEVCRVAQR